LTRGGGSGRLGGRGPTDMPAFFLFLSLVCALPVAAQTWQLDCVPAWSAAVPARCAALRGTVVDTCCVYRVEEPEGQPVVTLPFDAARFVGPRRTVWDVLRQAERDRAAAAAAPPGTIAIGP
jgi:hypothetical protein